MRLNKQLISYTGRGGGSVCVRVWRGGGGAVCARGDVMEVNI